MGLRFDRKIIIGKCEEIALGLGESRPGAFVALATVWAAYSPVSDGERLRAAAVEQKSDARFQLRWSSRLAVLDGGYQIEFDGSRWNITGVKQLGRRRWLEITAFRIVGGAV